MARINLNVGDSANTGTGDTLRSAMQNVNTMFTELYASPLFEGDLLFSGNEISATRSNDDIVFVPAGIRISDLACDKVSMTTTSRELGPTTT